MNSFSVSRQANDLIIVQGITRAVICQPLSILGHRSLVALRASAAPGLGTLPDGTVRFSLGYFNTLEDVELAINAVRKIAQKMESFEDG